MFQSITFQIENFGLNSVDVKDVLLEMREYRMGLIQTPEQLRFSYQAIIEGTKQILNQNSESTKVSLYFVLFQIVLTLPTNSEYPISIFLDQ